MSRRKELISWISPWAMVDTYQTDLNSEEMYVFDQEQPHRTFFTNDPYDKDKSFTVKNVFPPETITHICVDGGLIKWGKECPDYIGDGVPHGRPDCMLISEDQLLIVELKTNVQTIEDKFLWRKFYEAMVQIREFYNYLRFRLAVEGHDLYFLYKNDGHHIKSFVCMPSSPQLKKTILPGPRIIPIVQRMTEIDRFTTATNGLKITAAREYELRS